MKKRLEQLSKFLLSRNLQLIEVCLIFVLLLWGFCRNLQSVEFQPDETFWIASSVRLDKFLAGDFDSPIWNEPFINYEVRPVPSYIVAIGQRLGHIKADTLPEYWDWGLTKEENISRGAMPSDPALWWSRLPMAVLTAFTFLGVIYFLAKAHSRFSAYIFGVISFNDYFLLHLRRAMSEAPLLFFTILVLYASYKLSLATQEGSLKKIIWWSFIAGVLSGLAGQSKLTGLACTAIPILFALLWLFRPSVILATSRFRSFFIVTTIVLFTSLLIFVVSYPFFYKNTLYRSIGTFYFRNAVIQGQSQTYASDIIPADDRIVILFQRIFEYPISTSSSDLTDAFFHWINFATFAFGVIYLIRKVWKKEQDWEKSTNLLLGALTCAVPMLFVPFDWDRYYLYPIFFACIFFSIGMSQLLLLGMSIHKNQEDEKLGELERLQA